MRRFAVPLLLSLLLAACAANPYRASEVRPGTPKDQVLERLGQPTRVVAIPGGERLQYSVQPFGPFAWMVDLDAAGRVRGVRQVLQAVEFHRIEPGQWTLGDVQREFGPPARIDGISPWGGPVLTYRWRDVDRSDMFWWVFLDQAGVVRRSHQGMDYVNAPNERS